MIQERSCTGIGFNFFNNTVTFKFYQGEEKRKAYIEFVALLNGNAKVQKYTSPKFKDTDNEKFTLRTWLIRLGMIGDAYKEARKMLLENLEGNGAFRYGKPEKVKKTLNEKVIEEPTWEQ